MRLLMLGTGPFAVPTLRALLESPHEVAALVTRPDRAARGRRKAAPNPMRAEAESRGLTVLDPEDLNTEPARASLAALRPELLVVCDYGQILSSDALSVAPHGGINLHGSLLPAYRGAAPVAWAIYHGERETGNTVIHMTPRLDAGPALAQCRTPIGAEETAGDLEARLADLGGPLVLEVIDSLAAGTARPIPQDGTAATRAPRLKKSDGRIDWSRPAEALACQVRAFQPWPGSFTEWTRDGAPPLRLIVDRVSVEGANALPSASSSAARPGEVLAVEDVADGATHGAIHVATGSGTLSIERVQPAGKRAMDAAEFLRGHPLRPGARFE